jgi:hypothetical protein
MRLGGLVLVGALVLSAGINNRQNSLSARKLQ